MPRPNDPMTIDLAAPGTTCIAFAATNSEDTDTDRRGRWTELSVWRLPDGRYMSQVDGCSSYSGEKTKRRRLTSVHLDRVLKLFDNSDYGIMASESAREWVEQRDLAEDAAAMKVTDQEALVHLYGEAPTGRKGYSGLLAADFGASESTVRTAIANGTPIKVPLAGVVPFLDPALLARVREMSRG